MPQCKRQTFDESLSCSMFLYPSSSSSQLSSLVSHLQWERQQELLQLRRASLDDRDKYFQAVEDRRIKISEEQKESEQVWVDDKGDSSDVNPLSNLFGGGGGGTAKSTATTSSESVGKEGDNKSKTGFWPF